MTGCVSHSRPKAPADKDGGKDAIPATNVGFGSGYSYEYRPGARREIGYEIRWRSGQGHIAGDKDSDLALKGVSGIMYQTGAEIARFAADSGTASRSQSVLHLRGNVRVTWTDQRSKLQGATLSCDAVDYAMADQIIKATGSVTVTAKGFRDGPLPELWCANDLSQIATPDAFVPVRHNQPSPATTK